MSIRYSDSIKKPNTDIEYTPEMITELAKSANDINYFLKYVKIIHPDKGIIPFTPYDFQKNILTNLQNNRYNVILASRQSGKCVHFKTTITIRDKTMNQIYDIEIGKLFIKNK